MSNVNNPFIQELLHTLEARKQTEQRLKATLGVLLARSENQVLILETLLKRLVQLCVHTQDKRLAKELRLMDFTRLAKKISEEHTNMRRLLIHEDGLLGPSPSESILTDPMAGANNPLNMQNGPRLDDAQLSSGANAVNLPQYHNNSQGATALQQHLLQQQKPQSSGPHISHLQPSQTPPLSQAPTVPMRRENGAPVGSRDPSLQLRNIWSESGNGMEGSSLAGMPGGVPGMNGMPGPNSNPLILGGRGQNNGMLSLSVRMHSGGGGAGSQMSNPPSGSAGGLRGYSDTDHGQPYANFG